MTDIDSLVNRILVKNATKCHELVIGLLKSHGLNTAHVSDCKYKIVRAHSRQCKAQDAARKTKEFLLHECPELHAKNVEARVEYYNSVVEFEV